MSKCSYIAPHACTHAHTQAYTNTHTHTYIHRHKYATSKRCNKNKNTMKIYGNTNNNMQEIINNVLIMRRSRLFLKEEYEDILESESRDGKNPRLTHTYVHKQKCFAMADIKGLWFLILLIGYRPTLRR